MWQRNCSPCGNKHTSLRNTHTIIKTPLLARKQDRLVHFSKQLKSIQFAGNNMNSTKCSYSKKKSLDFRPKKKCLVRRLQNVDWLYEASFKKFNNLESQFLIGKRDDSGSNESTSHPTPTFFSGYCLCDLTSK